MAIGEIDRNRFPGIPSSREPLKFNSKNSPKPRRLRTVSSEEQVPLLKAVVEAAMTKVMQGDVSESNRQGIVVEDPETRRIYHMWDNEVDELDGEVRSVGSPETGLFIEPVTLSAPVILTSDKIARRRLLSAGKLMILPRDPNAVTTDTKVALGRSGNKATLRQLAQRLERSKPLDRTGH